VALDDDTAARVTIDPAPLAPALEHEAVECEAVEFKAAPTSC
jgi:hypothetical protein